MAPAGLRQPDRPGADRHRAAQRACARGGSPRPTCSPAFAASARPPPRASSPRRSTASAGPRPSPATSAGPAARSPPAPTWTCSRSTPPPTPRSSRCASSTESLRYGPARDRYKVVVLDEVHRLSRQAFDALLKIVEEPPPHLVFIFATTEIDAVPATILSRCQEFHFRRVPGADARRAPARRSARPRRSPPPTAALRLIARAGEGSVRDSVALLDQLATFGGGTIDDEDAARLLGGLDPRSSTACWRRSSPATAPRSRRRRARVEEEGWDPRHVYAQFLAYCRDALHLALGGEPRAPSTSRPRKRERLAALARRRAATRTCCACSTSCCTSEALVRRSEAGALALEIAWLRAAELPKLVADRGASSPGRPRRRAPGPGRAAASDARPRAPAPAPPTRAAPRRPRRSGAAQPDVAPPARRLAACPTPRLRRPPAPPTRLRSADAPAPTAPRATPPSRRAASTRSSKRRASRSPRCLGSRSTLASRRAARSRALPRAARRLRRRLARARRQPRGPRGRGRRRSGRRRRWRIRRRRARRRRPAAGSAAPRGRRAPSDATIRPSRPCSRSSAAPSPKSSKRPATRRGQR